MRSQQLQNFIDKMNADKSEVDTSSSCASCGIAENDDIKLKNCTACYLVRYCSIKCQKEHRSKHKKACKKRAAELRDELLFKQPDGSCLGDCPICLIPHPFEPEKTVMTGCCSKQICRGCYYANQKREREARLEHTCPFCREPTPATDEGADRQRRKRIAEANDPAALREVGRTRFDAGDYKGAFEYWTKAAVLGDVLSHFQLSCSYRYGHGVEKDEKRAVYHLEQAAIGGHPQARNIVGHIELENGRYERAIKHLTIAATLGDDQSLEALKELTCLVSKEDLAATLRAHQAAVDATKSPHREAAEAAL